ncbi:MAG: hypothetical protein FWC03_00890 [Treponema sp.]|nr:hypothetical protein [Treponema sp.]
MKNRLINCIFITVILALLSGGCASGPENAESRGITGNTSGETAAAISVETTDTPVKDDSPSANAEILYEPDELGFTGAWSFNDEFYGYIFDGSNVKLFNEASVETGNFTYTDTTVTFSFADRKYTMEYTLSLTELNLTIMPPVSSDDNIRSGTLHKLRKPVITEVTVTEGNTLTQKLQWLRNNAISYTAYTLEASADETLTAQELKYAAVDVKIILKGLGDERIITISGDAPLFSFWWNVTLNLEENITLRGSRNESNKYLVLINEGGVLVMNDGVKITGHNGGGVSCYGIFYMNGGEISGNTSRAGAGVNLTGANAAFTMNNGKISDNIGAGVRVSENAAFTMSDGELSRNDGAGVSANISGNNRIVLYNGNIFGNLIGVSIFGGTLTMFGGEIYGNRSTYPSEGAGVNVTGGTFRLITGTIYGTNETNVSLRNTATNSNVNRTMAVLSIGNRGQVERGIFVNGLWQSRGRLTNTSNTIRAVDGIVR